MEFCFLEANLLETLSHDFCLFKTYCYNELLITYLTLIWYFVFLKENLPENSSHDFCLFKAYFFMGMYRTKGESEKPDGELVVIKLSSESRSRLTLLESEAY